MTMTVNTRYGAMECLEADSVVSRSLSLYGEWAQGEILVVGRLLRSGDTVLDVGAFLGTHTLAFARAVGASGKVHSFEPREAIRRVLTGNVTRNGLTQVEIHPCALGERSGELRIGAVDTADALNFGGLAIEQVAGDQAAGTETIVLKRLDDLGFERIDLIKIDAEGMEAEVLAGGQATLTRCKPLIFAECNDLEKGMPTWQALRAHGYAVYGLATPAFDPDNFRGEANNIFGDAAEVSLLAVPAHRLDDLAATGLVAQLAEIDSLDALALLLLHKPQYPEEAWGRSQAAKTLGTAFKTPLSRGLQAELDGAAQAQRRAAEAADAANARIAELEQANVELRRERDGLAAEKQALERYLPSSLRYMWHRLLSRRS